MSGHLEDQIDKLGATALRIKAERDDLLAALELALATSYDTDEPSEEYPNPSYKWVIAARAAVKRARMQ